MTSADCRQLEEKYLLPSLPGGARLPFVIARAEGAWVFDERGERYLDLYGGHAVSLLGHSHPRWVEALAAQARELDFYSTVACHPARARAGEILVRRSYPSMAKVFFSNSGTEANETALKIARKHTRRPRVAALTVGFHGRTLGSLSVTGIKHYRAAFPENLDKLTEFVPPGDLAALEALDASSLAAVIIEPIPSVAGVYVAPPEYYRGLRELCTRRGALLIFDEVQTGSGRTGKWYVGHHWGVEPDIVTTAKGVAGGFPVGATIVNGDVAARVEPADQASTFGGGPLAAACVVATYRILEEEGLVERVARLSTAAVERLRAMAGRGFVREVRGLGYLLGIECERPAAEVQRRLLEKKILVGTSGQPNTIRLLPPLILKEAEWELFFAAFEAVAREA